MANYCVATDLYSIFGQKNISRWADLDNDKDIDNIDARITWACTLATEYINGRLLYGHYTVPFTSVPVLIVNLTAMYAGILLYEGRQVETSEEPHNQVSRQRKDFERWIKQIHRGQLKLSDATGTPLATTAYNAPFVVKEEYTSIEEALGLGTGINECCG